MATGYTRIGNMLIPYEKAEPVEKVDVEPVAEVVKQKRRGRPKKNDEES